MLWNKVNRLFLKFIYLDVFLPALDVVSNLTCFFCLNLVLSTVLCLYLQIFGLFQSILDFVKIKLLALRGTILIEINFIFLRINFQGSGLFSTKIFSLDLYIMGKLIILAGISFLFINVIHFMLFESF